MSMSLFQFFYMNNADAYTDPLETCKMKNFKTIIYGSNPLTIFEKLFILDE